ncbi:MAG: septum formation initiator family protein [Verrucomicrobiae bacterium]|nr:septum formation initiator family protein [Verrucomicrobiae bacterium]MDW8344200.1 septum formation initiator family protein [Verrucomicrobiae bacterium]
MPASPTIWQRLQPFGLLIVAAVVVLSATLMFLPLLHKRRALLTELERLDREIARQEALEQQQRAEIEALRTDPHYIERTIRDRLNLARPNELIFRFETPPAPPRQ